MTDRKDCRHHIWIYPVYNIQHSCLGIALDLDESRLYQELFTSDNVYD